MTMAGYVKNVKEEIEKPALKFWKDTDAGVPQVGGFNSPISMLKAR